MGQEIRGWDTREGVGHHEIGGEAQEKGCGRRYGGGAQEKGWGMRWGEGHKRRGGA